MSTTRNSNEAVYPHPASREEVQVDNNFGTLHGTLDLPEATTAASVSPVPAILMIAGSGPTDRDGNTASVKKKNDSLKMLGGWLTSMGYAVLRYDKRGVAESSDATGPQSEGRFEDMINDALLWVEKLSDDTRFSGIGICGHSEGSLVALCAARTNSKIQYVISLAGAGRRSIEVIREQLGAQPGFIRKRALPMLDRFASGEVLEKVPFYLAPLFNTEVQGYIISWNSYDPADVIADLNIPVLVAQGTTDIQTSIEDARLLAAAGKHTTLKVIQGMSHILKDGPAGKIRNALTYTRQGLGLNESLISALKEFLEGV